MKGLGPVEQGGQARSLENQPEGWESLLMIRQPRSLRRAKFQYFCINERGMIVQG
jgi:hypothetical protein